MWNEELRHEKDKDGRLVIIVGRNTNYKCKQCQNFIKGVYSRCILYPRKNWKANIDGCIKFSLKEEK